MRVAIAVTLLLIVIGGGAELYILIRDKSALTAQIGGLKNRLDLLLAENATLRADILYYSHPENLEKELRKKFNYRKPDERLLIVVP